MSWTVFHVAYHQAFANRLPYNVAIVELDEGPRMITNITDSPDGNGLRIGMKLELALQDEDGTIIARFRKLPVNMTSAR
jgi:uncharacterized OB-fold protein